MASTKRLSRSVSSPLKALLLSKSKPSTLGIRPESQRLSGQQSYLELLIPGRAKGSPKSQRLSGNRIYLQGSLV